MSFTKTLKRAVMGPGEFETILNLETEVFNDIQNFEEANAIKEKLRTIRFKLEDLAKRTTNKNVQKRDYLKTIYDGLVALFEGRTAYYGELIQAKQKFENSRNLSNTTTMARNLLGRLSSYMQQLTEKELQLTKQKMKNLSEKPQRNKERAQKTLKRVLVLTQLPQKNSYSQAELDYIKSFMKYREDAKKSLGFTEEMINDNPDFEDIMKVAIEARIAREPNPAASAFPSVPKSAAGTGLRGGKTRKQKRRMSKRKRSHTNRK
jgi:hypothetical protein